MLQSYLLSSAVAVAGSVTGNTYISEHSNTLLVLATEANFLIGQEVPCSLLQCKYLKLKDFFLLCNILIKKNPTT